VAATKDRTGRTKSGSPLGPAWIQVALCNQLAEGKITRTRLAEMYGVSIPSISSFAKKHAERIEALRQDASRAVAEIWIADKAARLTVLRDVIESLAAAAPRRGLVDRVTDLPWESEGVDPIELRDQVLREITEDLPDEKLIKRLMEALKQAAEELGQLPTRMTVQTTGSTVNYNIEGVDMDALR